MPAFNFRYMLLYLKTLAPYAAISVYIAGLSLVLSLILGTMAALGSLSLNKSLRAASRVYIYILRSTPSIVLLFLVFYGIPKIIYCLTGRYFYGAKPLYVILALSLLSSANMAEVLRGAYLSVDKGVIEAALSLGLSKIEVLRLIVLPEAAIVALPAIVNSTTALLKEGALSYTIGLIDLMGKAQEIVLKNFGAYSTEVYIALMLLFYILCTIIEALSALLERRLSIWRDGPSSTWHKGRYNFFKL